MENIGTEAGFCSQTAGIWQVVGLFLMIFKIVLPILLIIIGVITFGKAVISDDEKEVKKGYTGLFKKFILCIVTFFLPQIVSSVFTIVVEDFEDIEDDYLVCKTCLVSPKGNYCEKKVKNSKDKDKVYVIEDPDIIIEDDCE